MKFTPWLVLLSLSFVACSGSKSAQKVTEETPQIELSDADEFIENPIEEPAEVAELEPAEIVEEPMVSEVPTEATPETETLALTDEPTVAVDTMNSTESWSTPSSNESGTMKQYTVQKNETLMIIAFKLYGDYEKWKDLASQNREILNGSTHVREGQTLNYMAPAEEFVWNPQGLPYLIRTGDTLGRISHNVYATPRKWKMIWDNNRPLIKDPNKIFAGFTIYYLENGRDVANEI